MGENDQKEHAAILFPGRWHMDHFNHLGVSHEYYLHRKKSLEVML